MSDDLKRPPDGPLVAGVGRGFLLTVRGKPDGLRYFPNSVDSFLASLAPLVAFPLVGAIIAGLAGRGVEALSDFFAAIAAVLAPIVITYELARWWNREAAWLRFATAFNWCQWALPAGAAMLLVMAAILTGLGMPAEVAAPAVVAAIAGYGLWLYWFLLRHGLRISAGRAILGVIVLNVVTASIIIGPHLLSDPGATTDQAGD
jgi:hypothetical protein